jgi:hypothetical protein
MLQMRRKSKHSLINDSRIDLKVCEKIEIISIN